VVVAVKDRRERMLRCLDALLAQDHPDYDLILECAWLPASGRQGRRRQQ
jgi:hypothetical protein